MERITPCARCKKPLETQMHQKVTGYHGECWLEELRDRWKLELPGSHQRSAIENIVASVKENFPKMTEVGERAKGS